MAEFQGFIGPAYSVQSIFQDAQELINFYPQKDQNKADGERGQWALYPTEGLTLLQTMPNNQTIRGMYTPNATILFIVAGNILYSVTSPTATPVFVGTLATSSGVVYMSDNVTSLYIVDGANRYSCTITGAGFATLPTTDGAFSGATRCDYVDDFIVYNNPNTQQWGCTSAASTASPALSFSSKDSASDKIVSLIVDRRQVLLIGERTTEQWINVGAFPFPFNRIPGVSMQHGCAAANSVTLFGESTAWLAQDAAGAPSVIAMNGYQPQRISTHAVENDIAGGVISDAIGFRYRLNGHDFYFLTFPTQDKTWVFDLTASEWHKRAWVDSSNVLHRHRANCFVYFQGKNIVGDWQNGNIYFLDPANATDNGNPILRMRRSPHVTIGLDRVYHKSIQIQWQAGVGLATGQGSNPQCLLRWSDDGGGTYSQYYLLTIGKTGVYKNRAIKKQLGMARDRVYEVTITDPVYASIISAEIDIGKGDY